MSFALVLAAAVTLVVGLLQSGLTLIYVSIACSVVAGLVLALAVLRGRPEPKPATVGSPMSQPAAAAPPPPAATPTRSFERTPEPAPEREPVTVGGGWKAPSDAPPPPPPPPPPPVTSRAAPEDSTQAAGAALLGRLRRKSGSEPAPEPVAAEPPDTSDPRTAETFVAGAPPERADATQQIGVVSAGASDDGFPIPGYDRLRATDIIGRLDSLDRAQLEQVRERESSTKNRFTVMNRIDARLEEAQEPEWEIADDEWDEAPADELVGASADEDEYAEVDVVVEGDQGDQPGFPIPDYDTMRVSQILPVLATLSPEERDQVRRYEEEGRARSTILDRIRRLDSGGGGVGAIVLPPPAPEPEPAPAKRSRKASPKLMTATVPEEDEEPSVVKRTARKGAASAKKVAAALPTEALTKKAAPAKKAAPTRISAAKAVKAGAAATGSGRASRSTAKAGATPEPSSKRATAIKKATKKAR